MALPIDSSGDVSVELPLVAVGEQFTVGFGAEPQLQV